MPTQLNKFRQICEDWWFHPMRTYRSFIDIRGSIGHFSAKYWINRAIRFVCAILAWGPPPYYPNNLPPFSVWRFKREVCECDDGSTTDMFFERWFCRWLTHTRTWIENRVENKFEPSLWHFDGEFRWHNLKSALGQRVVMAYPEYPRCSWSYLCKFSDGTWGYLQHKLIGSWHRFRPHTDLWTMDVQVHSEDQMRQMWPNLDVIVSYPPTYSEEREKATIEREVATGLRQKDNTALWF